MGCLGLSNSSSNLLNVTSEVHRWVKRKNGIGQLFRQAAICVRNVILYLILKTCTLFNILIAILGHQIFQKVFWKLVCGFKSFESVMKMPKNGMRFLLDIFNTCSHRAFFLLSDYEMAIDDTNGAWISGFPVHQ